MWYFFFIYLFITTKSTFQVWRDATFDVNVTTDIVYGQGLTCKSSYINCTAMNLTLDMYYPIGPHVPEVKPAYILCHGGGNSGGAKGQGCFVGSAKFFASRGFVAFDINYRLAKNHGLIPNTTRSWNMISQRNPIQWKPSWNSAYPAVRDTKAVVRFVRSQASQYGIHPEKIAISGGSAGATNAVATGISFEDDYKSEISVKEDPTLPSTHLNVKSNVQCVVAHWSSDGEVTLIREHDPLNRTRYSKTNAPIIEFHGDKDGTIPIARAYAVQQAYNNTSVDYEIHVLKGCQHAAWCYNGTGGCSCPNGTAGYDSTMDTIALPFVSKHLSLSLV